MHNARKKKSLRNCIDGGMGRFMRFSKRRSTKNRTKVAWRRGLFSCRANGVRTRRVPKNEAQFGIDVSLESTTIGCIDRINDNRHTTRSREVKSILRAFLEFSKAIERGLFAIVTVRPIEITVVKRMDLACPFWAHYCRRTINTHCGGKWKANTAGAPLPSSEILMRDPLTNLRSIFPKGNLMDMIVEGHYR